MTQAQKDSAIARVTEALGQLIEGEKLQSRHFVNLAAAHVDLLKNLEAIVPDPPAGTPGTPGTPLPVPTF